MNEIRSLFLMSAISSNIRTTAGPAGAERVCVHDRGAGRSDEHRQLRVQRIVEGPADELQRDRDQLRHDREPADVAGWLELY